MQRNFFHNKVNTWPAFVDLFSNLVIVLIFLLIVFVFLWTTTSVFNKSSGVRTISELKATNEQQSEQIRQMREDNREAMRKLTLARARIETAEIDLDSKDLSIVDLITAYENKVSEIQKSDAETKKQVAELASELAAQQTETATLTAEYNAELKKLNSALESAENSIRTQEIQYTEMSNRLNRALADKVAELQDVKKYQSEFYRAIKIALGNMTSVVVDGDRFTVPSDILFPTGSYKLSAEGKNQLKLISHVIRELEDKIPSDVDWIIRIDGHTDNRPVVPGNRAYRNNMQLSFLRATAVAEELAKNGVTRTRLIPTGFGDMAPVSDGTDKASMQKNRRIELQLTNK